MSELRPNNSMQPTRKKPRAADERRFVTLGLLEGIPVSIVRTETKDRIHVISFRKATKRETAILFENL